MSNCDKHQWQSTQEICPSCAAELLQADYRFRNDIAEGYDQLHKYIVMMLHQLVYGEFTLKRDANERLLMEWYSIHRQTIESIIQGEFIDLVERHSQGGK